MCKKCTQCSWICLVQPKSNQMIVFLENVLPGILQLKMINLVLSLYRKQPLNDEINVVRFWLSVHNLHSVFFCFVFCLTCNNYRLIHGPFHIALVISMRPWYRPRGTISVEGWWQGQYEKGHVLIYLSHILPGQITCYCPRGK